MTIDVLIAARVRLYRDGLGEILGQEEDVKVIGGASDRRDTLVGVQRLRPDVVLLDPTITGYIDVIRELREATRVKVVALASTQTESEVIACAEAGVSGYVTNEDSLSDLLAVIRSVATGELVCSPRTAGTLLRRVAVLASEVDTLSTEQSDRPPESRLTRREFEVARLIDEGLSNKQIGRRLCIELPTVKHHVHHILEKLQVARRGEAVARLRQHGMLEARAGTLMAPRD